MLFEHHIALGGLCAGVGPMAGPSCEEMVKNADFVEFPWDLMGSAWGYVYMGVDQLASQVSMKGGLSFPIRD